MGCRSNLPLIIPCIYPFLIMKSQMKYPEGELMCCWYCNKKFKTSDEPITITCPACNSILKTHTVNESGLYIFARNNNEPSRMRQDALSQCFDISQKTVSNRIDNTCPRNNRKTNNRKSPNGYQKQNGLFRIPTTALQHLELCQEQ